MNSRCRNPWLLGLVWVLLYAASGLQAQSNDKRFVTKLQVGFVGSQVGGDGMAGFHKLNVAGGIGIATNLASEGWGLEFEIDLAQKGSKKRNDPDNLSTVQYKMDLWYAEVPVLFTYQINDKFSALGGPALGVLLWAKESDFYGELTTNRPAFNRLDLSLVLGARYSLSDNLFVGARLGQSLTPIRTKRSGTSYFLEGRQYNTTLGVMISYYMR